MDKLGTNRRAGDGELDGVVNFGVVADNCSTGGGAVNGSALIVSFELGSCFNLLKSELSDIF